MVLRCAVTADLGPLRPGEPEMVLAWKQVMPIIEAHFASLLAELNAARPAEAERFRSLWRRS